MWIIIRTKLMVVDNLWFAFLSCETLYKRESGASAVGTYVESHEM